MSSSTSDRPFITCHVLDTVSGKPAANVPVKLQLLWPDHNDNPVWQAQTNSDGRVTAWQGAHEVNATVEEVRAVLRDNEPMRWCLTLDTESYFGENNTFWPEIDLKFIAKTTEQHYHVPLLLGPWSYTTYRGS